MSSVRSSAATLDLASEMRVRTHWAALESEVVVGLEVLVLGCVFVLLFASLVENSGAIATVDSDASSGRFKYRNWKTK